VVVPNCRTPYPPEFRDEAVRLSLQRGERWKDVAHELGISGETLGLWRRRATVNLGQAEELTCSEQQELQRLRRRVRRLEEE
jgi:transposase